MRCRYYFHLTDSSGHINGWKIVKEIKILGITFPTSSRFHIKDTIHKLQNQPTFWKRLKLPLYTKLVLLSTYTKFQFTLPILNFTERDVKKIVNLVNWGISNHNEDFKPKQRYNPLFSTRRCFLSSQNFGFHFEAKLQQAQLARVARIINISPHNTPAIYYAQRLHKLSTHNIKTFKHTPSTIQHHITLWRRKKKIEYDPKSPPRSKTFKKLLKFKPPQLHETPLNVPNLSDWPTISTPHSSNN